MPALKSSRTSLALICNVGLGMKISRTPFCQGREAAHVVPTLTGLGEKPPPLRIPDSKTLASHCHPTVRKTAFQA